MLFDSGARMLASALLHAIVDKDDARLHGAASVALRIRRDGIRHAPPC